MNKTVNNKGSLLYSVYASQQYCKELIRMKKYDIALFDLDGTLSESGEGIIFCVRKIFEEME